MHVIWLLLAVGVDSDERPSHVSGTYTSKGETIVITQDGANATVVHSQDQPAEGDVSGDHVVWRDGWDGVVSKLQDGDLHNSDGRVWRQDLGYPFPPPALPGFEFVGQGWWSNARYPGATDLTLIQCAGICESDPNCVAFNMAYTIRMCFHYPWLGDWGDEVHHKGKWLGTHPAYRKQIAFDIDAATDVKFVDDLSVALHFCVGSFLLGIGIAVTMLGFRSWGYQSYPLL
eukprot:gnl/TRDRNA2_/TRDRNA2_172226_c0_seq4.p1 gnl/TRDRNA2_/TRDRNA2_172226_c0~~gnl/TRDRNA2_/TRDRNA2_172226_c0_seq4.p1  ORF type:complete len:230 (+),score=22.55 gnl/TRDRNA2_/TRDRNA2_172226_c0_seq4:112-801(+)